MHARGRARRDYARASRAQRHLRERTRAWLDQYFSTIPESVYWFYTLNIEVDASKRPNERLPARVRARMIVTKLAKTIP